MKFLSNLVVISLVNTADANFVSYLTSLVQLSNSEETTKKSDSYSKNPDSEEFKAEQ